MSALTGATSVGLSQVEELLPLSVQQEAFLTLHERYPNWTFLMSTELRLRGPLDIWALRQSLSLVVQRHESLRTRFVVRDDIARQHIDPVASVSLEVSAFSDISNKGIARSVQRVMDELFNSRTNFSSGPLHQFKLIRISRDDHVLIAALNHAVTDPVSFSLFFRELWQIYGTLVRQRQPILAPVPVQYADYAIWQRLVDIPSKKHFSQYWRTRLAGAIPLRMQADGVARKPRLLVEAQLQLDKGLSDALSAVARYNRSTISQVILAVYAAAAALWCKQSDFILTFGVTSRFRSEHVGVTGMFASSVPIRIQFMGDETFLDLLSLVSEEVFSACEHFDFGAASFIENGNAVNGTYLAWLGDSHDLAGLPSESERDLLGPELTVETLRKRSARTEDALPSDFDTQCDILWEFRNTPQGILGQALYCEGLFLAENIRQFCLSVRRVANFMVCSPRMRISEVTRAE